MSRSNPTAHNPHPSERWFEWDGGKGGISYYDKAAKATVEVPLPFTFIWLDETATIKGWHDASESGIMSNEVRDTRSDVMVVKAFKAGELCHGLYAQIRDKVGNLGGRFTANTYLGFRDGNSALKLGCLQLKGAALNHWVEFKKANFKAISAGAVTITGDKPGKKGSVNFFTPVFESKAIKPETDEEATALDRVLQTYLLGYFARTKSDQVALPAATPAAAPAAASDPYEAQPDAPPDTNRADAEAQIDSDSF